MLKPVDKAPSFRLASTGKGEVTLSKLKGEKFVLYFYPKDATPGCTLEACDFRDNFPRLGKENVRVYGVSQDSIDSHDAFRAKYELPFPLLSDPDNRVAKAYGAYGEKTLYGRKFMGTIRSTFVIDEKGRIDAVFSPVRVKGHIDKVLEHVRGETAPAKKKAGKKKKKK